jgi:hypothetical protein
MRFKDVLFMIPSVALTKDATLVLNETMSHYQAKLPQQKVWQSIECHEATKRIEQELEVVLGATIRLFL